MKPTIPVHSEKKKGVVYGECAQCGRKEECPISNDSEDGSRATRMKLATKWVLDNLAETCEGRTPWNTVIAHVERFVPKGLSLFAEDVSGKLWPLTVDHKGLLSTVSTGCALKARIWVVPDRESEALAELAIGYATVLRKKGYQNAEVAHVGYKGRVEQASAPAS